MDFDRDAYLDRIGLDGAVPPTSTGLEALHRAQTYTIPFENFDIHLGRGVSLKPETLFDKLVGRPRGGYCFELNGLFGMALDAFGFERRPLLARVQLGGRLFPRTHLLNLVRVDGRDWIADVGFGSNQIRAPLPLERDRADTVDGGRFRLVDAGDFGTMLQTEDESGWQNLYSFDMEHVWPIDIEMGNYFTSTHPEMFFTWARMASLPNPLGGTTLLDFRLREICDGAETVTDLQPGADYLRTLEDRFGIVIDAPYESLKPVGMKVAEPSLDLSAPAHLAGRASQVG